MSASETGRKFVLIAGLGLLGLDAFFLRWVWAHFDNWGFWDWDYQQSLFEAARVSILDFGQLPLWNPWLGGGVSLAGNSLGHAWAPCFLWILVFGTTAGVKLCIAFYLFVAQLGMWRLARVRGLDHAGAFFAAAIFTIGGVFAQRMTHGHFEWIAIAWMPHVLFYLHRWLERPSARPLFLGGLTFAFLFLDGGPYQFAFFSLFAGAYALTLAGVLRSPKPVVGLPAVALIGAGIAAIKLLPVYEIVTRFPRPTSAVNFYGAPFVPTASGMLEQMFLSRAQAHDPEMWMPYVLNVGCYVGWTTLAFAAWALARRFRKNVPWLILALLFLWVTLGPASPIDLWQLLHQLPFLSSLRVPTRFNVYILLLIALFAGEGLQEAIRDARRQLEKKHSSFARVALLGLAFVCVVDLAWVNGESFRVAFSIPPIETERHPEFAHIARSPFLTRYKESALYPVHHNWPGAAFPSILGNRGVIRTYRTVRAPSHAVPLDSIRYQGEVSMKGVGEEAILDYEITPNSLLATTDGRAGTIVFNVNYDPGWVSRSTGTGAVFASNGLVAVEAREGSESIRIDYQPAAFAYGASITIGTLFVGAIMLWRDARARTTSTS